MKSLTTLEIIIIIVILIVTALFILSWLGLGINPLEWFKKASIQNSFCSEIQEKTNCQMQTLSSEQIDSLKEMQSTRIKCKDIDNLGCSSPDDQATYDKICEYLGRKGDFSKCLQDLCKCKV